MGEDAAKLAAIRGWIAADTQRLHAARYASAASSSAHEGLPSLRLQRPSSGGGASQWPPPYRDATAAEASARPWSGGQLPPLGETVRDVLLPGGTIKLQRDEHGGEAGRENGAGAYEEWGDDGGDDELAGVRTAADEAAADAREAADYGDLLETLKELVEVKPDLSEPDAHDGHVAGANGVGANGVHGHGNGVHGGGDAQDLLAAGMMSGVDQASDAELAQMASDADTGETSIEGLRTLLTHALGHATFEKAHARLQTVVEEDDDDALVADIQAILGTARLDMLPMILKLIWLEGSSA